MNRKTTDRHPGTAADETTQTIELFGERLDRATPCTEKTEATAASGAKARKAAEHIDRAVTAAAERARHKTRR